MLSQANLGMGILDTQTELTGIPVVPEKGFMHTSIIHGTSYEGSDCRA